MTIVKGVIIMAIAVYTAILATLYLVQRRMMYLPDRSRIAPAAVGFARAMAEAIRTSDGETLVAWYAAPRADKPVILYFHGNGGSIAGRADRFARLTEDGTGLLAVSYRGYGGSTGTATETGLLADARAAYAHLRSKDIAPERIVLLGESLGSGVAVALASEAQVAAVVLEAPFSSTADVAAQIYWMFPVRWLMQDQFRSDRRIGKVRAPLLFVHGTADGVVPLRFGEKLFAQASEPKMFLRVENGGHQPLDEAGTLARVKDWLAAQLK